MTQQPPKGRWFDSGSKDHKTVQMTHLILYLNLTLFIVFDVYNRQITLLNVTEQLLAYAFKQEREF